MLRIALLWLGLSVLTGCMSVQMGKGNYEQADHDRCIGRGFEADSQNYKDCRLTIAKRRSVGMEPGV